MQYKLTWSAMSNVNYYGETEWKDYWDKDATEAEILKDLQFSSSGISDGLQEVLEASGFEWDIEVRDGEL